MHAGRQQRRALFHNELRQQQNGSTVKKMSSTPEVARILDASYIVPAPE